MKIEVAKSAGFCFGVNRAINMVNDLLDRGCKVCTLGPIIHNERMVHELSAKGSRIIDVPSQAKSDETIVIRTHGVSASVMDEIKRQETVFWTLPVLS